MKDKWKKVKSEVRAYYNLEKNECKRTGGGVITISQCKPRFYDEILSVIQTGGPLLLEGLAPVPGDVIFTVTHDLNML